MGMSEFDPAAAERRPWNAGLKVGAKRALKPRQVWAIRFFLKVRANSTAWSITASAPVDKSGNDTSLATLNFFTDSSTLKARVSRLWMTMPNLLTDPGYVRVVAQR